MAPFQNVLSGSALPVVESPILLSLGGSICSSAKNDMLKGEGPSAALLGTWGLGKQHHRSQGG